MARITANILERMILNINKELGRPTQPYADDGSANPGCLCLSIAYNSYRLEEINSNSGMRSVGGTGYMTAGELHLMLQGLQAGIDLGKQAKEIELNTAIQEDWPSL